MESMAVYWVGEMVIPVRARHLANPGQGTIVTPVLPVGESRFHPICRERRSNMGAAGKAAGIFPQGRRALAFMEMVAGVTRVLLLPETQLPGKVS